MTKRIGATSKATIDPAVLLRLNQGILPLWAHPSDTVLLDRVMEDPSHYEKTESTATIHITRRALRSIIA
jgi:hypothetical protein